MVGGGEREGGRDVADKNFSIFEETYFKFFAFHQGSQEGGLYILNFFYFIFKSLDDILQFA